MFSSAALRVIGCSSLVLCAMQIGCANSPLSSQGQMAESERRELARDLFAIFDINNDGFLTRQELDSGLRYMARVDGPKDGTLFALQRQKPSRGQRRARPRLSDSQVSELVSATFSPGTSANEALATGGLPGQASSVDRPDLNRRLSQAEFEKIVIDNTAPGREESLSGAAGWRRFL